MSISEAVISAPFLGANHKVIDPTGSIYAFTAPYHKMSASPQKHGNSCHRDSSPRKMSSEYAASVYSNSSSISNLEAEKRQAAAEFAARQRQQPQGKSGAVSVLNKLRRASSRDGNSRESSQDSKPQASSASKSKSREAGKEGKSRSKESEWQRAVFQNGLQ